MQIFSKEQPSILQNFGEDAESRFHNYLQQGSEDHYEINLMFIGQAGVGKTTLTKGLLGELDPHVIPASTNGIDLHQHRCKYDRQTRHIYPVSEGLFDVHIHSFSNFSWSMSILKSHFKWLAVQSVLFNGFKSVFSNVYCLLCKNMHLRIIILSSFKIIIHLSIWHLILSFVW